MADEVSLLQQENEALRAELTNVKQRLETAQRGNFFLIDLIKQQQEANPLPGRREASSSDVTTLQARLDAALSTNKRLQDRLSRRQNAALTMEGSRMEASDGNVYWVTTGSPQEIPAAGRESINQREHSRLVGIATWVEEKTLEGLPQYWEDFAKSNPAHSADEWRSYYESEVRPQLPARRENNVQSMSSGFDHEIGHRSLLNLLEGDDESPLDTTKYPIMGKTSGSGQESTKNRPEQAAEAAESSETAQMRTARPVHIRSYSKDDVKKHEIAARDRLDFNRPAEDVDDRPLNKVPPGPSQYPRMPPILKDWKKMVWYQPGPHTTHAVGILRTILITNLPAGTLLAAVLDRVHGGRVISAKFVETTGMKTFPPINTDSALIEFYGQTMASRFVDACSTKPISFPAADGSLIQAEVTLLQTASREIPDHIVRGMKDAGLTRLVYLNDHRGQMTASYILRKYYSAPRVSSGDPEPAKYPLRQSDSGSGALRSVELEFANVEDARKVHRFLFQDPEFSSNTKGFLMDPCALRQTP